MIHLWTDSDGYVTEWTTASVDDDNAICIEFDPMELLEHDCRMFKIQNNKLIFDEKRKSYLAFQDRASEIRARREEECFPVINRGGLWYDLLTDKQKDDLFDWYHLWLDATETLVVPNKPSWLE